MEAKEHSKEFRDKAIQVYKFKKEYKIISKCLEVAVRTAGEMARSKSEEG